MTGLLSLGAIDRTASKRTFFETAFARSSNQAPLAKRVAVSTDSEAASLRGPKASPAAVDEIAASDSKQVNWACRACTFLNACHKRKCEMCLTERQPPGRLASSPAVVKKAKVKSHPGVHKDKRQRSLHAFFQRSPRKQAPDRGGPARALSPATTTCSVVDLTGDTPSETVAVIANTTATATTAATTATAISGSSSVITITTTTTIGKTTATVTADESISARPHSPERLRSRTDPKAAPVPYALLANCFEIICDIRGRNAIIDHLATMFLKVRSRTEPVEAFSPFFTSL